MLFTSTMAESPNWRICFQYEFVLALTPQLTVHELPIKTKQYEVAQRWENIEKKFLGDEIEVL